MTSLKTCHGTSSDRLSSLNSVQGGTSVMAEKPDVLYFAGIFLEEFQLKSKLQTQAAFEQFFIGFDDATRLFSQCIPQFNQQILILALKFLNTNKKNYKPEDELFIGIYFCRVGHVLNHYQRWMNDRNLILFFFLDEFYDELPRLRQIRNGIRQYYKIKSSRALESVFNGVSPTIIGYDIKDVVEKLTSKEQLELTQHIGLQAFKQIIVNVVSLQD